MTKEIYPWPTGQRQTLPAQECYANYSKKFNITQPFLNYSPRTALHILFNGSSLTNRGNQESIYGCKTQEKEKEEKTSFGTG